MKTIHNKTYLSSNKVQKSMICVIDVLGFKNILDTTKLEELSFQYDNLMNLMIESSQTLNFSNVNPGYLTCGSVNFSDTLVLWCNDDNVAIECMILSCCDLLCKSLSMGLPLRGGISFGDCVMDNEKGKYLGKPIANAHELEKCQEWIGMALDDEATNRIINGNCTQNELVRYNIPTKQGFMNKFALNWGQFAYGGTKSQLIKMMSLIRKDEVKLKYSNTIKYIENTCSDFHANS